MEEIFKKDKDKSTGINFGRYDEIPVELSGNNHESIDPLTSFREARGVHPLLMENIIRVEYERPTPGKRDMDFHFMCNSLKTLIEQRSRLRFISS